MDTRITKFSLTSALAALIFTIGSAQADDTDVYMNPGAGLPANSEPLVMFSLDYRPNLGSTACNGSECDTLIAEGYLPLQASYTFFDVLRAALRKVFGEGERPLHVVSSKTRMGHLEAAAGFLRIEALGGGIEISSPPAGEVAERQLSGTLVELRVHRSPERPETQSS